MAYRGITKQIDKSGNPRLIVRFKFQNIEYEKNFTKLFGCRTEKQANDKLQEVKVDLSRGVDPFNSSETKETLDSLWEERFNRKVNNGEWRNNTPRNYNYFYNAHIKEVIGWKKISKITYNDLQLVNDNLSHRQGGTRNTFKRMMRPLFEDCVKKGLLTKNIVELLETQSEGNDKNIELRTSEDYLSIVRKIYEVIPTYKCKSKKQEQEIKAFLYLILLTAHRFGELSKLEKKDIVLKENKIISPPDITKTKEYYHFPIPIEVREYLESIEEGKIFPSVKKNSMYQIFQRLIGNTDIKFYNGKTISLHDTRRLMIKIMITDCGIDSMLADSCLSHKQQGTVKHYLHFQYKDIAGAYEKYWKKIKDIEESIDEDKIVIEDLSEDLQQTIKNLIKMENMKKQGLL